MSTKKRLFVAVNLSIGVTRKIAEAIDRMKHAARGKSMRVAWVPPPNLHVTLKFLGWSAPEAVIAIKDALLAVAQGKPAFDVVARGVGAFPNENDARIIWAGVEDGSGGLTRLQSEVEAAMARLGYKKEERAYSPHVTMGRVKDGRGGAEVLAVARPAEFGSSQVREIVLYESITKSSGSEYLVMGRAPLEGPAWRAERQTREVEGESTDPESE